MLTADGTRNRPHHVSLHSSGLLSPDAETNHTSASNPTAGNHHDKAAPKVEAQPLQKEKRDYGPSI